MLDALPHQPLTPLDFVERAARVHTHRTAVVDGGLRLSYGELWERARRLAGSLKQVAVGRPVGVLAPNTHTMLEAHFGVPLAGSPLVALNTRLSAGELSYILDHSETAVLLHDGSLSELAAAAVRRSGGRVRLVRMGAADDEYEALLAAAEPLARRPASEWELFSVNYTSGTTGQPKGVMYHHRGVYLQSLAMALHTGLSASTRMLWTLPMFHCHGWCFTYAVTAVGGTHVCQRRFDADDAWRLIAQEGITHRRRGSPPRDGSASARAVPRRRRRCSAASPDWAST